MYSADASFIGFSGETGDKAGAGGEQPEVKVDLDERLMVTPPIALERCREVTADMAGTAAGALRGRCIS